MVSIYIYYTSIPYMNPISIPYDSHWSWLFLWGVFSVYMGVSKNRGFPPKWMVKIMEIPIKNGWFGGTTIFRNIHIQPSEPTGFRCYGFTVGSSPWRRYWLPNPSAAAHQWTGHGGDRLYPKAFFPNGRAAWGVFKGKANVKVGWWLFPNPSEKKLI